MTVLSSAPRRETTTSVPDVSCGGAKIALSNGTDKPIARARTNQARSQCAIPKQTLIIEARLFRRGGLYLAPYEGSPPSQFLFARKPAHPSPKFVPDPEISVIPVPFRRVVYRDNGR